MNVIGKYPSQSHSIFEIAFYSDLFGAMPFLLIAAVSRNHAILVIQQRRSLVIVRSILGSLTIVTIFAAYALMPLADAAVLLFTTSLFVPILGVIFLKEHVGTFRWVAIFIEFIGVIIMIRPISAVSTLGVVIALSSAFLQAIAQILWRYLGSYERSDTMTFYTYAVGTMITVLILPFVAVMPTLSEMLLFVALGLCGACATWLLSSAFCDAKASIVTVFNYSSIVWASLFGWLIWSDTPTPTVLLGGSIVITSNIVVLWRESCSSRIGNARLR